MSRFERMRMLGAQTLPEFLFRLGDKLQIVQYYDNHPHLECWGSKV